MTIATAITYKQMQRVKVFHYLRACADQGATRADIATLLGLSKQAAWTLLEEMVEQSMITKRRAVEEPRAPWRYFALEETWKVNAS